MNTLVVLSVLVASCYAGYDKRPHGGYKYGTCPYYLDYGGLGQYCFSDYQCPGAQKCCNNRCQVPLEAQRPGSCPNYPNSPGTGRYCNTDRDCFYNQKCCTGPYGTVNTCKYIGYYNYPYNTLGGNVVGGNVLGGNVGPLSVGPFGTGVGPYSGALSPSLGSGPVATVTSTPGSVLPGVAPVLSGGVTVYDDDFSGVVGAPGVSGVLPGVSGVLPGVSGVLPGVSGVLPGVSGVLPGVSGVLPGVSVPAVGSVPSFAPVRKQKVY